MIATFQLPALAGFDGVNDRRGNTKFANGLFVQHTQPAGRDGAHGELFVARDAEFAHEKRIEGRVQRRRHLGRDWHATPGQSQHEYIGTIAKVRQPSRELSASVSAIAKWNWHSGLRVHTDESH